MSDAGVAFVQLVPSMRGFSREVSRNLKSGLAGPLRKAGDDAGGKLAGGISSGVAGAKGKLRSSVDLVGKLFKAGLAAAGVAAGVALAAGISGALEQEAATDKLVASLGGSEWAAEMGVIAGNLYRDAFGESIADTGEVVQAVIRSPLVAEDDSFEVIEDMTARVLTFTDVMDKDMERTIRATSTLLRTGLARDGEQALDILTRGIQQGADQADDLLDTFTEYPTQFRALGLSAEDAMGLLIQGLKAGARDSDVVADALKEFADRGKDASEASAKGFALIGLSADEMTAKVAAGGPAAREALGQVLDGLKAIEDPALRNEAAIALFGEKAIDLQDALFALDLDTAAMRMGTVEGATDQLGSAYDNAATRITAFRRKAMGRLVSFIGGTVLPGLERMREIVGPILSRAFETLRNSINLDRLRAFVDIFLEAFSGESTFDFAGTAGLVQDIGAAFGDAHRAVQPFFDFISEHGEIVRGALLGIGLVIGGVLVVALVGMAASMIAAAAPFLVIAALAAAVGAGILFLWNNVDGFQAFVNEHLPQVGQIFADVFTLIQTLVGVAVEVIKVAWALFGDEIIALAQIAWDLVSGIISGALDIIQGIIRTVTALIQGDWEGAWEGIQQILSGAWEIIETIISAGLDVIQLSLETGWELIQGIFSAALDFITDLISDGIDDIVGFFEGLPGQLKSALSGLADLLSAPFRAAFNSIKSAWNNTVGGFSVNIPGFLGFGGVSFSIASMHSGGIVPGRAGQEVPIMALAGEGVFTQDQMAAIDAGAPSSPAPAPAVVTISADGDRFFMRWLQHTVRVQYGGDVARAFKVV